MLCPRPVNSGVIRLLRSVGHKRIVARLIETWLPPISLSIACGVVFSMLAFLLQFTPLVRVAQVLAWPGYLLNAISPIDDTPAMVQERVLAVGIALIVPVYAIIFLVAWFLFLRGLIPGGIRSPDDV